jgi:hypothetical protein
MQAFRSPLAPLLAALLLLAGCSGSQGNDLQAAGTGTGLDPSMGRIKGQVVDEELRALDNATVTVADLKLIATTNVVGDYEIVNIAPGEHDVMAYRLGYEPQGRRIKVEAGGTATLVFSLKALPANGTFHETFPFTGHEPCQWYVQGTIAHCTLPYTQVYGAAKKNGANLSQYGLPPDIQQNKDRFNFSVRPDYKGAVSELFWSAGSTGAIYQVLVIMCPWYDPVWDECVPPDAAVGSTGVRDFSLVGKSPIRIEWNHPDRKHLRMAPYMWSRANVNGGSDRPVGVALDQKVDFYNTVFYGGPPPDGFSAGPKDG